MSSAKFGSAREINTWVEEQFPKRNWLNRFKRYLGESAKERRYYCKPNDGPSLEDCCAAFKDCVPGVRSFRAYRAATNASKKEDLVAQIATSLVAYRSRAAPVPSTSAAGAESALDNAAAAGAAMPASMVHVPAVSDIGMPASTAVTCAKRPPIEYIAAASIDEATSAKRRKTISDTKVAVSSATPEQVDTSATAASSASSLGNGRLLSQDALTPLPAETACFAMTP